MKVNYYQIESEFRRSFINFTKLIKNYKSDANFILGKNVKFFERAIAKLLGCNYVIGVANGTDAIELSIKALGLNSGDEILTTSNTFIATANAIINAGCVPRFVDIDETMNMDPYEIEKNINKKTKAIIPVHLNGMPCCMKKINAIAKKYKLKVIEDAAQAICSKYAGKFIGNSQNLTCFSLHPTKNLGVLGDGGFITTNSNKIYKKLCLLRNHGLEKEEFKLVGRNSRLDDIDALIGFIRLRYIKKDTNRKLKIAKLYDKFLSGLVKTPYLGCCENIQHTYHRYVIRAKKRDILFNFLRKKGIDVKIHYKKNIHEQKYYKNYLTKKTRLRITTNISKEIISLPCNHFMKDAEVFKVIYSIKEFFLNQNYKF